MVVVVNLVFIIPVGLVTWGVLSRLLVTCVSDALVILLGVWAEGGILFEFLFCLVCCFLLVIRWATRFGARLWLWILAWMDLVGVSF